jgi:hypothetical protein
VYEPKVDNPVYQRSATIEQLKKSGQQYSSRLQMIDAVISADGEDENNTGRGGLSLGMIREMDQTILIRLSSIDRTMQQNHQAILAAVFGSNADLRAHIRGQLIIVNNNIRMFGVVMEGGFRVQRANTGGNLQRLPSDPNWSSLLKKYSSAV